MIKLPTLDQASDISGKKVFLRADIDVPLENGVIGDDTRLRDIWPTVEFLFNNKCQVFMAGHLGRPEGKVVPELSSSVAAEWMQNNVKNANQISNLEEVDYKFIKGFKVADNFTVLENLRFDPREEANDPELAKELASLADIYVNEAFAVSEREQASLVGVPKFLPHFAGFRLAKEVEVLSGLLESPRRPMVVIIGGAKLETKIPVIGRMAEIADVVVAGGKLLTQITVGSDLMKNPKVRFFKLTDNEKDTTLESIDRLLSDSGQHLVSQAGTIVWNGPVGYIEDYTYQVGSRRIAELVAASKAYKVIGGGDTVGFVDKLGLMDKFDWVCSGGGSMLKFLAGEKLPGVEALLA